MICVLQGHMSDTMRTLLYLHYLQADEELRSQQAKHTVQLERLETEKQQLRQEIIRLQLLNKVMSHPMILLRFTQICPWLNLLNGNTVEPLLYDHPQNHIGVVV